MVSICHSVARETRLRCLGPPRASLSFALSPFFLALSTQASLSRHALTHAESIFEFGGRAPPHGRWLDITRILEHLRTFLEFDPRIPEVAPKISRLPLIPFLSVRIRRTPNTYELTRLGFDRYGRLTIENLTRNSMYSQLNCFTSNITK